MEGFARHVTGAKRLVQQCGCREPALEQDARLGGGTQCGGDLLTTDLGARPRRTERLGGRTLSSLVTRTNEQHTAGPPEGDAMPLASKGCHLVEVPKDHRLTSSDIGWRNGKARREDQADEPVR